MSAGEKFADADLIGIPFRIVVSKRSNESAGYELKKRKEDTGKTMSKEDLFKELKNVQ
jgi:prolyl-tRNA synthetase